ncbi:breast cancer anti-estrogen resistance protein 3 homolog isoform X2 [Neocloeon triangulifer]|uniref:breast cancer anti-estrogen resistance protein 3 homolog isoform X2 n=1 Tax=Neocloeon triangulifer TaxID=2078957 RepID=UPI00286F905C|nr:breast cancer anti-estrogen resistance protein 3 homolog isoform X2 [Neocloeon triangulifer]
MGKNYSKHKERSSGGRFNSLARSFRFASLTSLTRRKMSPGPSVAPRPPHLDVHQWLMVLDVPEYAAAFASFSGVEELLWFTEADIKELGVRNSAHRARIMSSLVALRSKYERGNRRRGGDKLQRHSVAVDSGRLVDRNISIDSELCVNEPPQSKSLDNLAMEESDPNAGAIALRKALEWELSLDSRDMRSHAWYHGAIPRPRAEDITSQDGHFLVRDCTSQPGDYVLSCRYRGQALHFVINKVVLQPDTVYERVQYQFEDEAFDTVPDLITFYVGSGKSISQLSGARIHTPRNRLYPLSFYASKFPAQMPPSGLMSPCSPAGSLVTSPCGAASPASRLNMYSNNMVAAPPMSVVSPPSTLGRSNSRPGTPPKLPTKHRSHSLTASTVMAEAGIRSMSIDERSTEKFASLPRNNTSTPKAPPVCLATMPRSNKASMMRVTSDPALSPCMERRHLLDTDPQGSPPPKPSRVPCMSSDLRGAAQGVYHASGSDSGNGSGDSVQSSADAMESSSTSLKPCNVGVVIKNPSRSYTPPDAVEPVLEPSSAFDLDSFATLLLPVKENKPLDAMAMQGVRLLLAENGSRVIANHLTKVDLELTHLAGRIVPKGEQLDLGLGVHSGIELCSLPHGHQLRLDLIERTRCMQLFVAITILSGATDVERADTLHRWIQVAVDVKTALGNLYGFCAVMMGLSMPQIQRLSSTWHVVRQRYTDSAFNFEAKLRPVLKSMNECTNPQAPNTTIPHLLPFVLLHEREHALDFEDHLHPSPVSWENANDQGILTLFEHLQMARKFADKEANFRRNAEIVLSDAKIDDLLLDAFRTEFHLKFLWGSRGAGVSSSDRHAKFLQVVSAMSEKCEPSGLQSPCTPTMPNSPSITSFGPTHTAV